MSAESVIAHLADDHSSTIDVHVSGGHALWTAGLSGEALQPTISGSSATWCGTAVENFSGRESEASFEPECAP